ncbi:MAG TPA: F0F1 ATP synthase subunit gamma [Rhizobiales bacterium]|nr:ATP synthase gamma chain [bacterium BMS3Bbin10]HDO52357.1 F0F1 ATP synthase subunit gamma [Hyphomicrobiales bacterium]
MPSLKDLRNRIASVKATQKITKAMQMVAAAKLRRAQEAAEAARPYAERMDKVLANLAERVSMQEGVSPLLAGTGSDKVRLLVVATAERGLCGGFNSNIARLAREHIRELLEQGKTVKILCVGRKGRDALKRDQSSRIIDLIDMRGVKKLGFEDADKIGQRVLEMFANGEFDVCTLFFSQFQSVLTQEPTALQLIPVKLPEAEEGGGDAGRRAAYEYEPEEDEILEALLPLNISTQIYRGLLENAASEQGARMTAMDNATRNAGDMIDDLTLLYNRSRQAQITKELIEIVSGAEAL